MTERTQARIRAAARTEEITYAVRDIVAVAKEAEKAGKELLYLNIGDPNQFDFETPPHLAKAVAKAMRDNRNGYSPSSGIPSALAAIEREAAANGIRNIRDIFVTTGGSEAIELCLTALVDRGDNILTPYPGYPLYEAVLAKLQCPLNPYYLDEEDGWQPDLSDLRSKIDSRTRAIVLINPNNPTGSMCGEDTLRGILEIAREHGLVVFSDEIYDKMVLAEDKKHVSIASLDPEAPVITFNGLSKGYLAPGWRIGWGIASGRESQLKDYLAAVNRLLRARLCASHPMQHAIAPALGGDKSFMEETRRKLRARAEITHEMLNSVPGMSCVKPEAAFYAFPRLEVDDDEVFVKDLIRATGVVPVHGSGFGQKPGTRHLRVVFLPPEPVLRRAYAEMASFFRARKG